MARKRNLFDNQALVLESLDKVVKVDSIFSLHNIYEYIRERMYGSEYFTSS